MAAKAKKVQDTAVQALFTAPDQKEVDEFAELMGKDARASLNIVEELEITSRPEHEFACNALQEVAYRHDVVDAKRKEWTSDLRAVIAKIDGSMKAITEPLKKAEKMLKDKIGAYRVKLELERSRLLKMSSAESRLGHEKEAAALITLAEEFVEPKVEGVTGKTVWSGEVIDPEGIPVEYMIPDEKQLLALTEALGGDPGIPGWRAFPVWAGRANRKGLAE